MSLENQRQLAQQLGLVPAPVEPDTAVSNALDTTPEPEQGPSPPDFDGGVREPAPGPTDPEGEHREFLTDLFRNA